MRANQLHFAIRKFEPFEKFIQQLWQDYTRQTGCPLELVAAPMDLPELHNSLLTENGLKTGQWDLALISADWIREAIMSDAVHPIEPLVDELDYFEPWPHSLLRAQKHGNYHYGVPFHDGPECMIYRKDLFEDPMHQEGFLLQYGYVLEAPKNWASFYDIARYFHAKQKDLAGTALAGYPDGHNGVYDFCLHCWSRGGEFIQPDGQINFHQRPIEQALSYYRKLAQDSTAVHKDSMRMDSVQLGIAFARGELAMMINWFGFATYAAQLNNSPVSGKISVAPIPHQAGISPVAPNSFWVYGIGSGSQHAAIAMDFIQFATTADRDVQLTLNGGIGCRKSTWHDPAINSQLPFFHQLEDIHQYARELPDFGYWPSIATIIDEMMVMTASTDRPIADIISLGQSKAEAVEALDLQQNVPNLANNTD